MLAAQRRDMLMARLRPRREAGRQGSGRRAGPVRTQRPPGSARIWPPPGCASGSTAARCRPRLCSTTHATRVRIEPESKRRVGARAAYLITPGSTVILDGGTTGQAVAEALRPDLAATIITHSPITAAALMRHPTVQVFILGGMLDKDGGTTYGGVAAEAASTITADLYLMVATGIHEEAGLTTTDPETAAMRRALARRAADTYVLGSLDKVGAVAPTSSATCHRWPGS